MKRFEILKDRHPNVIIPAMILGVVFFMEAGTFNTQSGLSGRGLTVAFAPFTEEWCKLIAVAFTILLVSRLYHARLPLKDYLETGLVIGLIIGISETTSAINNPAAGSNIIIDRIPGTILHFGTPIALAWGFFLLNEEKRIVLVLILPLMILAHSINNYLTWPSSELGYVIRLGIDLMVFIPGLALLIRTYRRDHNKGLAG